MSKFLKGHAVSQEVREKLRKFHTGRKASEETKKKMSNTRIGMRVGKKVRPEVRAKMFGRKHTDEAKEKIRLSKKNLSNEARLNISNGQKGKHHSKEQNEKTSMSMAKVWENEEYKTKTINNILKGMVLKPTIPEKKLDALLQENFPNQWIYNGDNSQDFQIGGRVPDFKRLDGHKITIELFSYHHCPVLFKNIKPYAIPKNRREYFKQFGYDLLVIWQPELKNPQLVIEKIREFNNNSKG